MYYILSKKVFEEKIALIIIHDFKMFYGPFRCSCIPLNTHLSIPHCSATFYFSLEADGACFNLQTYLLNCLQAQLLAKRYQRCLIQPLIWIEERG